MNREPSFYHPQYPPNVLPTPDESGRIDAHLRRAADSLYFAAAGKFSQHQDADAAKICELRELINGIRKATR